MPDIRLQLLTDAVRHASAGLKALETAQSELERTGSLYATHCSVACADLAHAIEAALQAALLEP